MVKVEPPRCPVLTTARLRLRMPLPADRQFLANLDADPKVMELVNDGPMPMEEALQYADCQIELAPHRWHLHKWLAELTSGHGPIGWVEVAKYRQRRKRKDLSDDIQLGYEFVPSHWNSGYATEACGAALDYAFEHPYHDRVVAYARPENLASLRVLEKLGFQPDGYCKDGGGKRCKFFFVTAEQWRTIR